MSGTEISIDVCKEFLAEKMKANSRIIGDLFYNGDEFLYHGEVLTVSAVSHVGSNWELEDEIDMEVDTDHDYYDDMYYVYETHDCILASDLVRVKIFTLLPDALDGAVKFLVYEDANKQLYLGEFVR